MPNNVKPIPEGHRTVAPYLAIKNADSLIMLSDEFPEFGGKAPESLGGIEDGARVRE